MKIRWLAVLRVEETASLPLKGSPRTSFRVMIEDWRFDYNTLGNAALFGGRWGRQRLVATMENATGLDAP